MRKVVLFIAMSLDGYIARDDGDVSWLNGQDEGVKTKDTYEAFSSTVDTVLMGWKTYDQVVNVLSPEVWPYADKKTIVFTHQKKISVDNISFTDRNPITVVKELQKEEGKDIWVCGGASIVQQLMQDNLIDRYDISIIPVILGKGIRLFPEGKNNVDLRLVGNVLNNGIAELVYEVR